MTSLKTAGCYVFLLRLSVTTVKLGRRLYRAVLMVQPVLRLKMNAVIVDRGFQQQAVEHQPGRPVPITI